MKEDILRVLGTTNIYMYMYICIYNTDLPPGMKEDMLRVLGTTTKRPARTRSYS